MRVLYIPAVGVAEYREIKGDLDSMRELVGGWIETVQISHPSHPDMRLIMVVDEEGLNKRKPMNILASWLYGPADIVGDVFVCRMGTRNREPDLVGLPAKFEMTL